MDFITSIASSVVGQIASSIVAPIERQIGYLIFYNRNIENLKEELGKLDHKKNDVKQLVDDAKRKLQVIKSEVVTWQKQADDVKSKADEFLENEIKKTNKCLNGLCPNPKSRYSFGRKAVKIWEKVVNLLEEAARNFNNQIAIPGPPPKAGSAFNLEDVKDFESRLSIENQVFEALKDDNLRMIGICGMGGVGKTTLVKKLMKRIESEKLFDEVAMAVVSQNPDLGNIQGQIADRLGLPFGNFSSLQGKADQLNERIKNSSKRILVILDDIWEMLHFEEIGLPLTTSRIGYKIVLTSRKDDVCRNMGSSKNFPINVLEEEESWSLFREMAGDFTLSDEDWNGTAKEIAHECGGLPIAIITVARALKDKQKDIWKDALQQLKSSNLKSISGMQKDVYSRIELSYNLLGSEEAKSCFLLCCLFPEDFNVPVEDLVRYGMGLELFKNVQSVHQVRNRVHTLVDELKESFLLLDGDSEGYECVKMHDLVRDVAISIASRDEHGYIISCDAEMKEWPAEMERYKDCTAISLVRKEITEHPVDLKCPKLQLLRLSYLRYSQSLPDNFLKGMNELRVVSLEIQSLPQPLDVLKKLRTLILQNLRSGEIPVIGGLISLEILQIGTEKYGSIIKELPTEIGELKNLKLLDLREMSGLEYIPPGVLSRLCKLEELYVYRYFTSWGVAKDGKANAKLSEIESHSMTGLQIGVLNLSALPKEFVYTNLARFKIHVPLAYYNCFNYWGNEFLSVPSHKESVNELYIGGDGSAIRDGGICTLLRKTEVLVLFRVSNLKNMVYELEEAGGNLKKLYTTECRELEYLIDVSKQSPHSQMRNTKHCFNNLKVLTIGLCGKLKYMFPSSVVIGLVNLESIDILDCNELEGIFYRGAEDYYIDEQQTIARDGEVKFPAKLKVLSLGFLQKLKSLWVDFDSGHLIPNQSKETQEKERTSIEHIHTEHQLVSSEEQRKQVMQKECTTQLVYSHSLFPNLHWLHFHNLRELKLIELNSIKVVFPSSIAQQFVQLEELSIDSCDQLQYIVAEEENDNKGTTKIEFPMLTSLSLRLLPELVAFCPHNHISFDFCSLKHLELEECPKMKTFNPPRNKEENSGGNKVDNVCSESEEESVKGFMCPTPTSIIPRFVRRQKSSDSTHSQHKHHQLISNQHQEMEILEDPCGKIYDCVETCCAFSWERMSNLKKANLRNCNNFKVIFSFEEYSNNDGVLNVLEELSLYSLSSLVHVWLKISPQITAFQNLKVLTVENCDSLINVFSLQMDEYMTQQMIKQGRREAFIAELEDEQGSMSKIVFPQLRTLKLRYLSNLRSFCIERCGITIEFPLLEELEIKECNQLKHFIPGGFVTTPKLKEIEMDGLSVPLKKDHLVQEMILTRLVIMDDNMYQLPPHEDSRKVLTLSIYNCETLFNAIPYDFVKHFQDLEHLNVRNCNSMIEIFDYGAEEGNVLILPHLEGIFLGELPKLEHLFDKKTPENVIGFQKLTNLQVRYCGSLKNIFSSCVIKDLQQLQVLKITECKGLKEIVVEENDEEESMDKITFPQLRILELNDLSELTCFYNGTCSLEFPLLQDFKLNRCSKMKTFSYGSSSTPKLDKVKHYYTNYPLRGDQTLNEIVSHTKNEESINVLGNPREVEVDIRKDAHDLIEVGLDNEADSTRCELDVIEEEATKDQIEILPDIKIQEEQIKVSNFS